MEETVRGETMLAGEALVTEPVYGGIFRCEGSGPLAFVLPGERVVVPVVRERLPEVLSGSPSRATPRCVHFGVCGGCQYQHAGYQAQLEMKREILRGLLTEKAETLPEINIHSGEPWGYRNRIRLRVEADSAGVRLGYSRPGTNQFLPVRMCPIAAPLLWRAAEALLAVAGDAGCRVWLRATSEVELFCLPDESRLQMTLLLRAAEPALRKPEVFAAFCERLRQVLPELAGAGAIPHPELNRRMRRGWPAQTWNAEGLDYPVAQERYWVGRGAFFQVNRFMVERLVELVCAGEAGGLAWDMYAGVGLFSKVLARRFSQVVAVEAGSEAFGNRLAAGRSAKGGAAFEAVQSTSLDFLRARVLERERPELIVLDPPRAGVGVEGANLLARIAAARVVYVSCDPETLARDLQVLTREVYRVTKVDLVDMFPQTFHIETVVHLARR